MNIAALLAKTARSHPGLPALTASGSASLCYAQFFDGASRIAHALRSRLSLDLGDRVAIAMANSPEYYQALFAIWHAGLVAVPMNAKLHPKEFAFIIENSGARLVFASVDLAEGMTELIGRAGRLERVVAATGSDWTSLQRCDPSPIVHQPGEAPAWLFYTSGTTGRPKGATLTHRNLLLMTLSYFADIDTITPTDSILHAAPMSHGSGLYGLPHVAKGANNVIPESGGFDPAEIFDLMQQHRGLTIFAAPTMVVRLMNSPSSGADTSNLKLLCYGGGPMYVADTERALDLFGPKLVQIYGQGESPMTITYLSRILHADRTHPRHRERLGSAGIARTDVEICVADPNDKPLEPGESGEVLVRGDVVMRGYWANDEATQRALRGGWLHTGDIGSLDEDGFLTLRDRATDLIISGGANIYPREVEEVLLRHELVLEAAAIGRPNPEWGEEVVAFVVLKPGRAVQAAELDALCLDHIARFKRPREYIFVQSLPKNNYGKVLKRVLRDRFSTS